MTEAEVLAIMRRHLETQFPGACRSCRQPFPTLRDYLLGTIRVGVPESYDVEFKDWQPLQPLGSVTFACRRCGARTTVSSDGLPLDVLWSLYAWGKSETERRGLAPHDLANYLLEEMCIQGLAGLDSRPG